MLTIASHRRTVHTEYGVLHTDGDAGETQLVTGFEEKPAIPYIVSMGVYVLEPRALDFIEHDEYLDLPDLVLRLLDGGRARSAPTSTRDTGSTSGATRTTRRR